MYVLNSSQMQAIDKLVVDEIGIPEAVLMENAGFCVFEEIKSDFADLSKRRVAVFCGKGNNGGDGFVVARYLSDFVHELVVFIFDDDVTPSSATFLNVLKYLGVKIIKIDEQVLDKISSSKFDIIVDAIFGTGLKRDVSGIYKNVIEYINSSSSYVYAVDIPSGICSDTGRIKNVAVRAHKTVTFFYPKLGNILYPGAFYCGKLVVKDIGIPERIVKDIKTKILDKDELSINKLFRYPDTHKADYGKLCIFAGSKYYSGAASLCSAASVKSGCGLCYLFLPEEIISMQSSRLPEVITIPVSSIDGVMTYDGYLKNTKYLEKTDVIIFGCGLTTNEQISKILIHILESYQIPMVIDADGLNVISMMKDAHTILQKREAKTILTPHYGEAARLLGVDISNIKSDPISSSIEIANRYNAICVLKGSRTIITDGSLIYINVLGNAGMAKGGSGDVLTGIIGSLLSQGFDAFEAAKLGVYLHSLSADMLFESYPLQSITPSDIIENVKNAILRVIDIKR